MFMAYIIIKNLFCRFDNPLLIYVWTCGIKIYLLRLPTVFELLNY